MKTGNFPFKKNARRIRAVERLKFNVEERNLRRDLIESEAAIEGWSLQNDADNYANANALRVLSSTIGITLDRIVTGESARSVRSKQTRSGRLK